MNSHSKPLVAMTPLKNPQYGQEKVQAEPQLYRGWFSSNKYLDAYYVPRSSIRVQGNMPLPSQIQPWKGLVGSL